MSKVSEINSSSTLKTYLLKIAPFNFYNETQHILRVEYGNPTNLKYFDFYNIDSIRRPNPRTCYALVETLEGLLDSENYAIRTTDPRYQLLPGYSSVRQLDLDSIPFGFVKSIMPQNATVSITTAPDSDTGMILHGMCNPSNSDNTQLSLQAVVSESYTKTRESMEDTGNSPKNDTFGFTIGDNYLLSRGPNGTGITMGPTGKMVFSGDIHTTKSKWTQGFMQDNPLGEWIPSSIVTAIPAMLKFPFNMDTISSLATMAQRIAKGVSTVKNVVSTVDTFIQSQAGK